MWKDYMVLSDYRQEVAGIDIIIDCTPSWHEKAGGAIVYTNGQGSVFYVPVRPNTLTFIYRNATSSAMSSIATTMPEMLIGIY